MSYLLTYLVEVCFYYYFYSRTRIRLQISSVPEWMPIQRFPKSSLPYSGNGTLRWCFINIMPFIIIVFFKNFYYILCYDNFRIASTHMPKIEPMDNSSIMTPDSIQSEGTPSESKSPPLTAQLSVDTVSYSFIIYI